MSTVIETAAARRREVFAAISSANGTEDAAEAVAHLLAVPVDEAREVLAAPLESFVGHTTEHPVEAGPHGFGLFPFKDSGEHTDLYHKRSADESSATAGEWDESKTEEERKAGVVNYIMGISFISEGAIPFAAADPLHVLVSCICGSAVAGALSMAFGCASPAPHGGLLVAAVLTNWPMFIVALIVGSIVGALILSFWKKPLPPEESGLEK